MQLTVEDIKVISRLVEDLCGIILDESKGYLIESRLTSVAEEAGCKTFSELYYKARYDNEKVLQTKIINAITTNETLFFRDTSPFEAFQFKALPETIDARSKTATPRRVRIWSAGCSTGQEAYSLAIRLRNEGARWAGWRIEILASDISTAAIEQARSGAFSQMDVQRGLAIGDLIKWFEPDGENWRASAELRGMIDFRHDNLFDARAPSGEYDLLLCRNVLLYFTPVRRQAVLRLLAAHSHAQSVLLLGAGETVIGHGDDFIAHPEFRGSYARQAAMPGSAIGRVRRQG